MKINKTHAFLITLVTLFSCTTNISTINASRETFKTTEYLKSYDSIPETYKIRPDNPNRQRYLGDVGLKVDTGIINKEFPDSNTPQKILRFKNTDELSFSTMSVPAGNVVFKSFGG